AQAAKKHQKKDGKKAPAKST
ncbi:acid-shock protein, partial [Salmonella enterica subsp. diarizonae]|nr:acid-shock protein [Salmonella enterica subsp. diarizonae]